MELLNKCKIEIDATTCSKLWSTTMYYLIILNVVQQMLYQLRCGIVLIGLLPKKKMQTGRGFRIEKTVYNCHFTLRNSLWPLFMDEVQLPQGQSRFKEVVYFLPLSSQIFHLWKFCKIVLYTLLGNSKVKKQDLSFS